MDRIIIIGGGVAGLTAGIYGQLAGLECTVIEKNQTAGGAMCGWMRDGYTIDGCLHWLTGTARGSDHYKIWLDTGVIGDEPISRPDSFYTSSLGGRDLSFSRDLSAFEHDICALSRADRRESAAFVSAVRAAQSFSGVGGSCSRARAACTLAPYARLDLAALSERFEDPLIKSAVTDYIPGGFSSLGLIMAYAAFTTGNADLPAGGSPGAARRMAARFESLGGRLITGARVERIVRSGRHAAGVVCSDGSMINGEHIISTVNPFTFFPALSDVALPRELMRSDDDYPVFSSVHFAFAASKDDMPFHGTRIFPCEPFDIMGVPVHRLMVKEYSHEASFAPQGQTVLQCMFIMRKEECRAWISLYERTEEYKREKERIAAQIISRIEREYPAMSGSIRLLDSWTPATFERFLGSPLGTYMSYALRPMRLPHRMSEHVKGLDNVTLATQWQCAPGGVPIAARMGKQAIEHLTGKHM